MKVQGREMCVLVFMAALYLCVSVEAQVKPIFINCGTKSSVTADGRVWVGDSAPNPNLTITSPGEELSTAAESIGDHPLAEIYSTARVFAGGKALNYTIRGLPEGTYVVRLHFCPAPIADRGANGSSFAVAANGLRLAAELDVSGEIAHRNSSVAVVVKEYFLPVRSGTLAVEFAADGESIGFVSAVEVVPAPPGLLPDSAGKLGGSIASLGFPGRGAETMYRLNVGGAAIPAAADPGMWRAWEVDSGYMITANAGSEIRNSSEIVVSNETAAAPPVEVYETARSMSNVQSLEKKFNMSWRLEVHPGFDYLVRLHFCELEYARPNQRKFRIFLNNRTAADEFDVFSGAGGLNRPLRHDFLDSVPASSSAIWIQLGPGSAAAAVSDAFLNGVEVFKLSRSGGSLAYAKRFEPIRRETSPRHGTLLLWVSLGSGLAFLAILAAAATLILRLRSGKTNGKPATWRPLILHGEGTKGAGTVTAGAGTVRGGKRFSLAEIRSATKNFDESLVIGVGGFGKVYRGETEDGTAAAVKRANPQSEQGLSEFETEIEMLSKLRHRHLVSMIGFCDEGGEMILVYEYMANGTLREHLFGGARPALTWRRRVEACIGAARGLHYLHTGADRGIIHRDVKTTNILLDADFVAKMADFGLSKDGPALDHTHVSTAVKGSFGYLDPEYFRRERLTEKSDVYSFGVVLFEVLCARPVINPTLPKEQINLAEWAMTWQRRGSLEAVVDQRLRGGYAPESVKKFAEIAEKCLADDGKDRPTMGEVLWHLEYVLQLHIAWLASNDNVKEEEEEERGSESTAA